jgi:hypothetical protein
MRLLGVLPRIGILAILFAVAVPPSPAPAQVSIGVAINIGPPAIPVYVQPPCPQPNYIWTPGYWQYGPYGYFWVPGAWVAAPYPGYLWTPGYWGWNSGAYAWHAGYWGRHVGFYGGVNYGFGFFGVGFVGGGWFGNTFRYNTAVVNVNRTVIRNVYVNRTVINNNYYSHSRVSYNGGPGGIERRPLATELAYSHETHLPPLAVQRQHVQIARQNRNFLASVNGGHPAVGGVARPLSAENRPGNFEPVRPEDRADAPKSAAGGAMEHPYRETHPQYNATHPIDTHPNNSMRGEENSGHHPLGNGGGHNPQGSAHHPMNNGPAHQAHAPAHPGGAGHPPAHEGHPAAHEEHPGKPPRR